MIPIQARYHLKRERGFALIEVLVAAAIAAGVVSAITSALFISLRTAERSQTEAERLGQARMIAARLHAGLPRSNILEGLEGWSLEAMPAVEIRHQRHDDLIPIQIIITDTTASSKSFSTIILAEEAWSDG